MLKIGVESPRIPEGFCRNGRCPEYATRWEQFSFVDEGTEKSWALFRNAPA